MPGSARRAEASDRPTVLGFYMLVAMGPASPLMAPAGIPDKVSGDPAAKAEGAEVVIGDLAGQELVGLAAEKLDVLTDDGIVLCFRMCMSAKG